MPGQVKCLARTDSGAYPCGGRSECEGFSCAALVCVGRMTRQMWASAGHGVFRRARIRGLL